MRQWHRVAVSLSLVSVVLLGAGWAAGIGTTRNSEGHKHMGRDKMAEDSITVLAGLQDACPECPSDAVCIRATTGCSSCSNTDTCFCYEGEWYNDDRCINDGEVNPNYAPCFPGDSIVSLEHGARVPLKDIGAGDRVLGASGYEPILSFIHRLPGQGKHLLITHSEGEFRATANHIVFVVDKMGRRADKRVGALQAGELLAVPSAQGELRASKILSVTSATGDNGFHAPLTASGTIVVDGVIASAYATMHDLPLPHAAAHAWFFPARMYHHVFGPAAFSTPSGSPSSSKKDEMHPFAYLTVDVLKLDALLAALS